jgi:L-rhamnose mutarotase
VHLKSGAADEYRRRRYAIWLELVALQRVSGVQRHEIHLPEAMGFLVANIGRRIDHRMDDFPSLEIWRRWQANMSEQIEQRDGTPVCDPLALIWSLPRPVNAPG